MAESKCLKTISDKILNLSQPNFVRISVANENAQRKRSATDTPMSHIDSRGRFIPPSHT